MLEEYYFKFSNGAIRKMTESGANRFSSDAKLTIIDCNKDGQFKNNKRIRDGWQKGWQPQLGMYVDDYGKYKQIIKDRGLIEMGNEKPMDMDKYETRKEAELRLQVLSNESLKEMQEMTGGLDLSTGDIEMLKDSIKQSP